MDKQTLEKAVEDISLIKQVIDRTSSSIVSFGQIFIWWGLLMVASNLIGMVMYSRFYFIAASPIYQLFLQVLIFLAGLMIYIKISRKLPLIGLSRQLMTLWLCIIFFSIFISYISLMLVSVFKVPFYNYFAAIEMTVAFGFICTSIFTKLKLPAFLAILYMLATIFLTQFEDFLPLSISLRMPFLSGLLMPLGFVIMGVYLEFIRIRRS